MLPLLFAATPFLLLGYLRYFIAKWAGLPITEQQHSTYKIQFASLSLVSVGVAGFTAFSIGALFLHLSNALHNSLLERVTRAPMSFFNSNPLGRIMTRFSKDTAMADSIVPFQVMLWLQVSLF